MSESVGSLRAYFVIVGLLGIMGNGAGLLGCMALIALKPLWGIIYTLVVGPSFLLSLGYLFCGIMLPSLLKTNAQLVILMIMARMALIVAGVLVNFVIGGAAATGLVGPVISLAISYYLLNAVKSLAGR